MTVQEFINKLDELPEDVKQLPVVIDDGWEYVLIESSGRVDIVYGVRGIPHTSGVKAFLLGEE